MASKDMGGCEVSIVRRQMVKPSGAQAHEGGLYMTAWDEVFGVQHNETVLFYSQGPSRSSSDWVEALRDSLGLALAQFSPLAGRIRWVEGEGRRRRQEILCNGEGAELVEAECDGEMRWFRDPADLDKVAALVPAIDYELPLEELPGLILQLTSFRCGGLALGFSMCHMACDGVSGFHFMSEWARLARGEPMKEAPSLLYRTMFRERERTSNRREMSDHIEYQNPPLMMGKEDAAEEWEKETVKFAMPLTKEQLDALKKAASSSNATNINHGASRGFSRYEVITAHIWRCLCKARGLVHDQETTLSFPINVRNLIHTIPFPQASFGNMIMTMKAQGQVGELITNDLGFVCERLREAINMVDEDYILSNFDLLEKQDDLSSFTKDISVESKMRAKSTYHGNPNLRVVSWLSLPMHGIDFGWGNYIDILPVARDVDGSIILLPMPEKDDGSIVLVSCLQVAHVDEFKKHFYQGINN